jgi:SepF-like predicted cell division protein (DUF552 family)
MVLDKIMGKLKGEEEETGEEFLEVSGEAETNQVNVRIETLKNYSDTDRVQNFLREGTVVFLNIRELREKDITELKRSVEKLKKTCTAMNGDMVGVDEDFLIITPQFAKIYRGKAG